MRRTTASLLIVGALVWIALLQVTTVGLAAWTPLVWMWLSGCSVGAMLGVLVGSAGEA